MAKSIRSKNKRAFRSKKREDGVYAATEAARLHRLNSKLLTAISKDKEGDVPIQDVEGEGNEIPAQEEHELQESAELMEASPVEEKRGDRRGDVEIPTYLSTFTIPIPQNEN
ncbi:hypothetical protein Hypma_009573 [Hypsizygus marmoreus]|uniref:DUF2423 domain-containing protein n=1 Tax=Hypsizygus marmoreus TaxID=39966 RepID=A0A369JPL6_HYPMA|nr:hypothetical protein Hypma_009573 [Hypsizygus marmoreus]